ncbi:MAG: chemotaxis protein [Phycisphaerae bacterium]
MSEAVVEDLTSQEYDRVRRLVYSAAGINLGDQKMQLVRARLGKHVRQGGFGSFGEYFRHVEEDASGERLCTLLDAITTNTTHLFREIRHFHLLKEVLQKWAADKAWARIHDTVRIWSAACSSGEEPHSIAMTAHDALAEHAGLNIKILATDLSTRMLSRARRGLYDVHRVGTVPPDYRTRYFRTVRTNQGPCLQVAPEVAAMITFSRFNLMTPTFPFRHGFDVIFCRNVMIYFDRATQQKLVSKLIGQLHEGGYLLIGHSESLTGFDHALNYVEPSVYRKE